MPFAGANALQYDLGPQTSLSWTTTLGYRAAYRVQDQKDTILNNINGDDGDRAFDGLFQNQLFGLTEVELRHGNFGGFIRGDAFFDEAYNHNDDDSFVTDNTPSDPPDQYPHYTRKTFREDARLLDAFVYGNFAVGSTNLNVRAGRQVISWGESLFLSGISTAQNPVDATKSHVPGTEVKEILLPVAQVVANWGLTPNLSVAAYYQWQWDATRLDGTGSYFSTTDILRGGKVLLANVPGVGVVPALQRTDADKPGNHDPQYGFNVHYTVPALKYTDFGAYYLKYDAKAPAVVIDAASRSFHLRYFDDIDLYGLSYATAFGRIQTGGEISLRDGAPTQNENDVAVRSNQLQAQVSTITNLPYRLLGSNVSTLSAEAGVNTITDRSDSRLANDRTAAGYQGTLSLSYTNVRPSLDLTVPISVKEGVWHNSSVPGSFNSGQLQLSIGANFTYQSNWTFGFNYVQFRGDVADEPLTDRDFVSTNVQYSF